MQHRMQAAKFNRPCRGDEQEGSKSIRSSHIQHASQLQPIKLPCFAGDIIEWQHFYNMFLELVHVRTDLTGIQKLHYLHLSLRDEALNVIKSLPITHENYTVAIDLLKARYDSCLLYTSKV